MKKWITLATILVLAVMCVGFASANQVHGKTMTGKPLPAGVQEEYLNAEVNDDGTIVYKTDEFEATVVENRETPAIVNQCQDDDALTMEALPLPSDVEEEYLDPIKIEDGVYEYRDSEGNLVATMYEYATAEAMEAANTSNRKAANETTYDIDMDVDARSEAYGSENIDITNLVTIEYDIDFARQTPSYQGKYVAKAGKVSWFTPASKNGFYRSINIVGSTPISVAIKNEGDKDNIYTGTVTVSPAK